MYPTPPFPRISLRRPRQRGFTLIEVIVVTVIIAVLAVLAVPSISQRMRDRRTSEAAQRIAMLYRDARMRAMGRGSAVLVRYAEGTGFELREGVRGTADQGDESCAALPSASCLANSWDSGETDSRVVSSFDPTTQDSGINLLVEAQKSEQSQLDVCFTPMGRAFVKYGGAAFEPLTTVPTVQVWRELNSETIGLKRTVLLLPNGSTRVDS